jgi:hypothetical protein
VEQSLKAMQERNVQRENDLRVMATLVDQLALIPNEFKTKRK